MTFCYLRNREISEQEQVNTDTILKIFKANTREMEGYVYFGSNPGISEEDYDDVADNIITSIINPMRERIKELEKAKSDLMWELYPCRMGS
jgi:hypothetical protein